MANAISRFHKSIVLVGALIALVVFVYIAAFNLRYLSISGPVKFGLEPSDIMPEKPCIEWRRLACQR